MSQSLDIEVNAAGFQDPFSQRHHCGFPAYVGHIGATVSFCHLNKLVEIDTIVYLAAFQIDVEKRSAADSVGQRDVHTLLKTTPKRFIEILRPVGCGENHDIFTTLFFSI